jgi:hypothetical protein
VATTGGSFDLTSFELAVHADEDIVGMLYSGSLGRGGADRYADLDIELWVTDSAFGENTLRRVFAYLGAVHFLYRRGEAMATGFVGPDWQRVDLVLHRSVNPEPIPELAAARVVKDTDGSLTHLVELAPPESVHLGWEQARAGIEEAIDSQIYAALHNARGAVWSAMGEVSYRCAELYILLALLRGRRSYGFRYVEQLLSGEEQAMMARVWPNAPARDEVRRTARELWHWTRHVWSEAESALGRSLEIHIDEDGMLQAVEQLYEQTR